MTATSRTHADDHAARTVRLYLTLGGAALLILGLIILDPVGKVACALVLLAVIQGLWRGSADVAGMLVGTLLAVFTAVPLAPWFEGLTRAVFGFSGLANRIAATMTAGVLVLLVVGVIISTLLRRLIRRTDKWSRWDTALGGSLGAAEGAILALAVTWTPVALAPIARAQLAQAGAGTLNDGQGGPAGSTSSGEPATARFVVDAADAVQRSALADLSNATNPIQGSRLVSMSGDVLEILSNDAMREHFLASPVMREIDTLPGVKRALDIINADKELIAVLEEGATEHAVTTLVRSDTVMRAIDDSGVVSELASMVPRIAEAVEAARASVEEKRKAKSEK